MYSISTLVIAGTILGLVLVKGFSIWQTGRRYDFEKARRGCKSLPALPRKDPLGLLRLIEALKAGRQQRMPQYVAELIDQKGTDIHTVQVRLLGDDVIVTRDPQNVEAIFTSQAQDFDIGANRLESFKPLLGVGVTTLRGEPWRRSRGLLRPQFSREQVSDLDLEERHMQALMSVLKTEKDGWTEKLDLQPLFNNLTHDTNTEMLYGRSIDSQICASRNPNQAALSSKEGKSKDATQELDFGHHLESGKSWLYERMVLGKLGWLFGSRKFTEHCYEVHKYVDQFVYARLGDDTKKRQTKASKEKFVLLDELAKHTQNPLELRNETLHVLSAGWDTTAALLGWLFYFLSRNPRVFSKLRSSILSDFSTEISFKPLQNSTYLNHCINETFRIAAIIPVIERVCARNTTLPRGGGPSGNSSIFVPKDSRILISTYGMQHRADIWGSDIYAFRPERWDGHKVGYDFVPFAGGPRKCIGRETSSFTPSFIV